MTLTPSDSPGQLRLEKLLGSGNERLCWEHPGESTMCVKTVRPGVVGRRQNDIDFDYYRFLVGRGIAGSRIPKVFGWVDTDHGKGLAVEKISGPDGGQPLSLPRVLEEGRLSVEQVTRLIDETFDWFVERAVVISDCNPEHLLLRQDEAGRDILVVVDGLGGRHIDFRYKLRKWLPWYARRKTRQTRARLFRMMQLPR